MEDGSWGRRRVVEDMPVISFFLVGTYVEIFSASFMRRSVLDAFSGGELSAVGCLVVRKKDNERGRGIQVPKSIHGSIAWMRWMI